VTLDIGLRKRLEFLVRVVGREALHLRDTDARLFSQLLAQADMAQVGQDPLLAERLDAFVSRFGRLQDTLADKFLPALLQAMAEPKGTALDDLDRAEKLGWLRSADQWLELRRLRNQMVHAHIEDAAVLFNALQAGHGFVPSLLETARRFMDQASQRLTRH